MADHTYFLVRNKHGFYGWSNQFPNVGPTVKSVQPVSWSGHKTIDVRPNNGIILILLQQMSHARWYLHKSHECANQWWWGGGGGLQIMWHVSEHSPSTLLSDAMWRHVIFTDTNSSYSWCLNYQPMILSLLVFDI